MIKLFASVCIEAPAEMVWARLAQLEDIQLCGPSQLCMQDVEPYRMGWALNGPVSWRATIPLKSVGWLGMRDAPSHTRDSGYP